jgi:hypothetical protein
MQTKSSAVRRPDTFCARMNDSLTVVAAVLGIVVTIAACEQRLLAIAPLFQPIDPETGISMLAY